MSIFKPVLCFIVERWVLIIYLNLFSIYLDAYNVRLVYQREGCGTLFQDLSNIHNWFKAVSRFASLIQNILRDLTPLELIMLGMCVGLQTVFNES